MPADVRGSADFEAKGFPEQFLERRGMPPGRPELELRVAARSDLQQTVLAMIVQVEAGDGLRVAAIEALGQPENGRERPHDEAPLA